MKKRARLGAEERSGGRERFDLVIVDESKERASKAVIE